MLKNLSIIALFVGIVILLPYAQAESAETCSKLVDLHIPGMDVEITGAKSIPSSTLPKSPFGGGFSGTIPPHCRVDGVMEPRIGVNDISYGIGFAITLPADWNGRLLFQGGGGLNGTVQDPLGINASGDKPALTRGFAVVSTDSGHKGKGSFDGDFLADQEATLNFLYQANGKIAEQRK